LFRNKRGYVSLLAVIVLSGIFTFAYLAIWNVKFSQINLNKSIIAMDNFTNSIIQDYDEEEIKNGDIVLLVESSEDISDQSSMILKKGLFLDEDLYPLNGSPLKEQLLFNIEQLDEEGYRIKTDANLSIKSLVSRFSPNINYQSINRIFFNPRAEEMKALSNTGDLFEENGKLYLAKIPNPYLEQFESVQWPYNQEEIFKANTNISTFFEPPAGEYTTASGIFVFKKQKKYDGIQEDFKMISVGEHHILGITQDDTVIGWGRNKEGQLDIPEELTDGSIVVSQVSAGKNHSLAIDDNGDLYAWGDDSFLQTTIPIGLSSVLKVKAGVNFSIALKNDGTVAAWGLNSFGQSTVPAGLTDVIDIAVGNGHAIALKDDSSIVAWGKNSQGQTSIPSSIEALEIYAGNDFSLIKKTDGDFVSYGSNDELIPIPETQGIGKAIVSPFANHAIFIMEDESYLIWGNNEYNQIEIPEELIPIDGYVGSGFTIIETIDGLYALGRDDFDQLNIPNFIKHIPNDFSITADYIFEDGVWKNQIYFPKEIEDRFVYFHINLYGEDLVHRFPNETDDIYLGSVGLRIEKYLITSKEK
jgi:hypothetical protein